MTHRTFPRLVAAPFLLVAVAACSAASDGDDIGSASSAITQSSIVSRGMEWVNAKLRYCWSPYDKPDPDSSCWSWEKEIDGVHVCSRESNSAWNAYRSDCSGFVSFAWGLPAPGYTTCDFAPYGGSNTKEVDGKDLEPGDALNLQIGNCADGHIILFKGWANSSHSSAVFMEEPGCSANPPWAHEFTAGVQTSGSTVTVDGHGYFSAIRFSHATK